MAKNENQPVWAGRLGSEPDPVNIAYCAGRDVSPRPMADAALVPYDIWLNQAHALMLFQQKIISKEAHQAIQTGLKRIHRDHNMGRFQLSPELEDVHMNIERHLINQYGEELAGVLHTGRSRNDQSATDVRMFLRWHNLQLMDSSCELVDALLSRAEKTMRTIMPGFSHTQPASLTTFAHFLCSHAQALSRDLQRLQNSYQIINESPLGAAAGFGTAWGIQRQSTARWLGFRGIQENSIDCISSRWEMEAQLVTALTFMATHLSILAQDIIFLSSHAMRFIRLPDAYVTGSSIMPQKRNPDFAEVTRAKCAMMQGHLQSLFSIAKGAISGYNRDSQWTKYIAMDAVSEMRDAPYIFTQVINGMALKPERMRDEAARNFITAIDLSDQLAEHCQLTFRQSYLLVGEMVKLCEKQGHFDYGICMKFLQSKGVQVDLSEKKWLQMLQPERLLTRRKSYGGPAPGTVKDSVNNLRGSLIDFRRWSHRQIERIDQARKNLRDAIDKAMQ
ncbi:argininosuccinate lyase [Candidatus Sumerlaeota bacterium]|nr:argininosuccinate lyase [Candidatus Sumerlaeota bacterium]